MFTIKLTGDFTGYTVSGYALDQDGNIVQVGFYSSSYARAKQELEFYSDKNGFECRRIVELKDCPKLNNSNLQAIRNFIFNT